MALQQSTRRQVPNLAKISPPKPPQLGKTHKFYITQRSVFVSSAVLSSCFIAFGLSGVVNDGFSGRIEFPPNIKWMSLSAKINANGDVCELEKVDGFEGINVCYFGDVSSEKSIALHGDSHAEAISDQLDIALKAKGFRGVNVALDGCEVVLSVIKTNGTVERVS